jgi:hypothetical protein
MEARTGVQREERAAFDWCEELTLLPDAGTSSGAYDRLTMWFDPREIIALTTAIIAINGWNRLHVGLGAPSGPVDAAASMDSGGRMDPRVSRRAARLRKLGAELAKVREDYRRAIEGPPGPRDCDSGHD